MSQCRILYGDSKARSVSDLKSKIKRYLRHKDFNLFINDFIEGRPEDSVIYKLTKLDSEDTQQKLMSDFIKDFQTSISDISKDNLKLLPTLNDLLHKVLDTLHIEMDRTQDFINPDPDSESKSTWEERDENETRLYNHIKEIYGTGAYNIIESLNEEFKSDILAVTAWDLNQGTLANSSNITLNQNIIKLKNRYFKQIVDFLKQEYPQNDEIQKLKDYIYDDDFNADYFKVMRLLYNVIKNAKDFNKTINTQQTDATQQTDRNEKIDMYRAITKVLLKNDLVLSSLKKNKELRNTAQIDKFAKTLYSGDMLSSYYSEAKDLVETFELANEKVEFDGKTYTISELFNKIETFTESNLLSASKAYTCLTHFDEMVKDAVDVIDVDVKGNVLSKNNYKYKTASGHFKKGFQQSEAINTEKYVAALTNGVMGQIRVFDYQTGMPKNRRVNSTTFIMAARNLVNDVLFNKLTFTDDNILFNKIVDLMFTENEDVRSILKTLFEESEKGNNAQLLLEYKEKFEKAAKQLLNDSTIVGKSSLVRMLNQSENGKFDKVLKTLKNKSTISQYEKGKEKFINLFKNFHGHPENFEQILTMLFDKSDASASGLIYNIDSRERLTDYDLDLLYSVYQLIYNKNNPKSLRNTTQEQQRNKKSNSNINILDEFSAFVDRNTNIDYGETVYNQETGQIETRIKRKFYNGAQVFMDRQKINTHINKMTLPARQKLQDEFKFSSKTDASGKPHYTVELNGQEISLTTTNIGYKILSTKGTSFEYSDFFRKIDQVDLETFREKCIRGGTLDENEMNLRSALRFIDSYLQLGILSNPEYTLSALQTLKNIYNPKEGELIGTSFIQPFVQLAMRAAYVNKRFIDAGSKPIMQYLDEISISDDGIYQTYLKNKKTSRKFSTKFNKLNYLVASYEDKILELWEDAKSTINGDQSKSTTKDHEGNSIPNNSVNKLGSNIHYYLEKQKNSNVGSLLFVTRPDKITGIVHDLEVTTRTFDKKSLKAFTAPELFYHSIFNKFYGNYLYKSKIIVQPTTYSDKTTFINYEVDTIIDGVDLMTADNYKELALRQYAKTIGVAYKNIWKDAKEKLMKIANLYNSKQPEGSAQLGYEEVLKNLNEDALIALAREAGVKLELDKDYRKVKGDKNKGTKDHCTVNELLQYYAEDLYNIDNIDKDVHLNIEKDSLLSKALKDQEKIFVQNLTDTNSTFNVLDFGVSYNDFIEKDEIENTFSNPILNTILKMFQGKEISERKNFFKNWVDEKTGLLIIAKQGDANIIRNSIDSTKPVQLNPLLERFFYVEGLISNNLRMSLTGSEINHPDKAFDTIFNQLRDLQKKINSLSNELSNEPNITKQNALTKQIDGLKTKRDTLCKNNNIVTNSETLSNTLLSLDNVNELRNLEGSDYRKIYELTMLSIANVAQGTQFKRNVIIPATLQYCQQNVFDGIKSKIKCAVIRDESASVYNYRGDHEKDIDSADGAAKIISFQSILENRSLGSQAVGFTKKPIWHSYDASGGTAFLGKFATNTITNEEMRASSHSHTNLYNLFRKMTDLRWGGKINLLQTIAYGNINNSKNRSVDLNDWFKFRILRNSAIEVNGTLVPSDEHRLIYQGRLNEKIEIVGFDATTTESGDVYYFTEEKPYTTTVNNSGLQKVYHMFYDEYSEDGKLIAKAKHKTFDTWQQAKKFKDDNLASTTIKNVTTIDSLFQLHTALGGINTIDADGKHNEFSNEVVVNFMCEVGNIKPGTPEKTLLNQTNVEQPLKDYYIGYALNNTSVKNGAQNINNAERWYNNEDLDYFDVDSDGLGMQMNADHDIVNSELTEFSQVITATAAYGYSQNYTSELFTGLAQSAIEASSDLMMGTEKFLISNFGVGGTLEQHQEKINAFIDQIQDSEQRENLKNLIDSHLDGEISTSDFNQELQNLNLNQEAISDLDDIVLKYKQTNEVIEKAKSEFYEAIGRIIFVNQSIKDKESLQHVIIGAVQKVFFNSNNHKLDNVKIPFSDPNIYSEFISTLSSTINKESIKRKHPGSGCVIVPGYNIIQYHEFAGQKLMTKDILKNAYSDYKQDLIQAILNSKRYDPKTNIISFNGKSEDVLNLNNSDLSKLTRLVEEYKVEYDGYYKNSIQDTTESNNFLISQWLKKQEDLGRNITITPDMSYEEEVDAISKGALMDNAEWFMPSDIAKIYDENGKYLTTADLDNLKTYYKFKDGSLAIEKRYDVTVSHNKDKQRWDISLNEDGNQSFRIEQARDSNGKLIENEYNIHFRTGTIDPNTLRRIRSVDLQQDQLTRLFNAALQCIPDGGVLSLSPTTADQIASKQGGLTKGSYFGYTSILENEIRRAGVELEEIPESDYDVQYFDNAGDLHIGTVKKYVKIKNNYTYQNSISSAHNLRPSIIRWKYEDNGVEHWMNIFDTDPIRNSYFMSDEERKKNKEYRSDIQEILHNLEAGSVPVGNLVKGTLENTAAELVMSNLYKDKFGIGNESLQEILSKGQDYFYEKQKQLRQPQHSNYDIAFLKDSGRHVLISLSEVGTMSDGGYTQEDPWDENHLSVNEKGEIYHMKGNKKLFKVGKWANVSDENVQYNIHTEKFETSLGTELDQSLYRLKDGKIQKKIWYVKRYSLVKPNDKGYNINVLYEITSPEIIEKTLEGGTPEDAKKQIAKILGEIYTSDNFKAPTICSNKTFSEKQFSAVKSALGFLKENYYVSDLVKNLINAQINNLTPSKYINEAYISKLKDAELKKCYSEVLQNLTQEDISKLTDAALQPLVVSKISELRRKDRNLEITEELNQSILSDLRKDKDLKTKVLKMLALTELKAKTAYNKQVQKDAMEQFMQNQAKKQWVSFLDSQNWIAARIPAQTLQSFMSMKTIAWTENSTNMAYVSHFQTYLQGSDYDIDKAYIMGQSYSENGEYIGWSPMFNFESYATLQASKKIPVPKFKLNKETGTRSYHTVVKSASGLDVTDEFKELAKCIDTSGKFIQGLSEENIIKAINTFSDLIRKIHDQTEITFEGNYDFLVNLLNKHYHYRLKGDVAELAYKNVASANIYNVAHDIRNRDQAYTAISMDIIREASTKSPKGNQAAQLNMFNPLTKYMMQYQNILGKNVISIAANAEKVWFNAYNHWHEVLKHGSQAQKDRLKFQQSFSRIQNRSKSDPNFVTIKHLPDLNKYDEEIRNELIAAYGATDDSLEYKYVDQLISQLLSAATDNAKELILAKINAGTNYARMYVYGLMMGFNFDDLISFMTSPISEYIDSIANQNIFSPENVNTYASTAISKGLGKIAAGNFLHGSLFYRGQDGEEDSSQRKTDRVKSELMMSEIGKDLSSSEEISQDISLNDLLQKVIQHALKTGTNVDFIEMFSSIRDREINNYASYVDSVFKALREVVDKYKLKYLDENLSSIEILDKAYSDYIADAEEFQKLYQLSSEVSSIASSWLGLNQGLPTSELEILQRLARMSKTVTDREKVFGINSKIFPTSEDSDETVQKKKAELVNIVKAIKENNPTLFDNGDEVEQEAIILEKLNSFSDIAGKFDIYQYITNEDYKKRCIEYYDLIKGTLNMMEMMEVNPNYNSIMEGFKSLLVANRTLSAKSRLIDKIIEDSQLEHVSDSQLRGIINYVDQLNVVNFMKTLPCIHTSGMIRGFNVYFKSVNTDKIDLSTFEGMATFKSWLENEFFDELKNSSEESIRENDFIKHLTKVPNGDQMILATDIDLLNPNLTIQSRLAYDKILSGISDLENIYYEKPSELYPHGITLADLFQMYNLIVNHNRYGGERLTTTFKVCEDKDNVLNNYLKFISEQDYSDEELEFNKQDYLMSAAPLIYESQENLHSEEYVKVRDDIQGFKLKKKQSDGTYQTIPLLPMPLSGISNDETYERLENYSDYSTFTMPFSLQNTVIRGMLDFDDFNSVQDKTEILRDLTDLLKTNSFINKILIYLDCHGM